MSAAPALAKGPIDHEREYGACMQLARTNPIEGFESALAWADHGGGDAAQHCAAVALLNQGKPDVAALRLEQLAKESKAADAPMRAQILGQAAQAWVAAGQPETAETTLNAALELSPGDPTLLIDRGAIRGQLKRYGLAIVDLNEALKKIPNDAEALLYRAAALRQSSRPQEALADVEKALQTDPGNADALLERGLAYAALGDLAKARQDLVRAAQAAPDSPVADAAQSAMQAMDVRQ